VQYRQAKAEDIPQAATLFLDAFAPSVKHFLGRLPSEQGIRDVFAFILKAEPQSFFVAADAETVTGYLIASRSLRSLWLKALTHGQIFIWLFHWASGRYQVGTGPVTAIIRHKLLFLTSKHNYRSTPQAQILSFAVHPDYQNKKIGRNLLNRGLAYLKDTAEIKLEVRPENIPARHLYQSCGFVHIDTTTDSQGDWLVMIKCNK
jgi:ribosomal protein S18 acetylase RimI-like enzyme